MANYLKMIDDWAYEDHTLQSNEGPSFVAHQYAIAGQSGGLNSSIAPDALAENPSPNRSPYPGWGTCFTINDDKEQESGTVNMTSAYPGDPEGSDPPCQDYQTILDLLVDHTQVPPYDVWQYIAFNQYSIWAAPMSVTHLYNNYIGGMPATQPFAVDPDAENFILNLTSNHVTPPTPNPIRPFAQLTYITPCFDESDHPNDLGPPGFGIDNGPNWLAWLLNGIRNSQYWQNTAVIVTWDDWGGFYDNYTPGPAGPPQQPYHPPLPNAYTNAQDPNEWGFRVPLYVISPYVKSRGYVSTNLISQGAVLNYIESIFGLSEGALAADDYNNHGQDLSDMLDYSNSPLGWENLPTSFVPKNQASCPPDVQLLP